MRNSIRRLLEFSAFIVVFSGIYFLVNYFTAWRISSLLGVAFPSAWWSLAMVLCFPLSQMLEKRYPTAASRVFYTGVAAWMGTVFILFTTTIIVELLRLGIPFTPRHAGLAILMIGLATSIYAIVNGCIVKTKTHTMEMPGLKHPLRVVQLSDVHLGTIRNGPNFARIVRKVNALRPDIVVITGDLVDGSAPLRDGMVSAVNDIKAPVYAIIGNHEVYEGLPAVVPILERTKMRLLRNEIIAIHGVQIAGIDYVMDGHHAKRILKRLPMDKSKPAILLYHLPELSKEAAAAGFSLQLSGHTHSGQIWPFNFLVRIVHKYVRGAYDIDGMRLYVSPGTGMWGPPMRLGSSNEITLHLLRQE